MPFKSSRSSSYIARSHHISQWTLVSRISDYILYSVEAGSIDKVVEQYGPCMCRSKSHWSVCSPKYNLTRVQSYQARCHRRWSNVLQGPGARCVRKAPTLRRRDCILPLAPRSQSEHKGSASGMAYLAFALQRPKSSVSNMMPYRSSSNIEPRTKASNSLTTSSPVSDLHMSTSPARCTTALLRIHKLSLTQPS